MSENQKLFALLIDGDNTQSAFIPQILGKLSEYGERRISKVFHNKTTIEQWEQVARKHAIDPIWVPNNIKRKNTVDIALVIEAMSLCYKRNEITGFCLVASDGDYTRLASHLKSEGKVVLGIGEKKTPDSFTNACTKFIFIEDLMIVASSELDKFRGAYEHAAGVLKLKDKDGWVMLALIGETMRRLYPDHPALIYRDKKHKQLKQVVEKMLVDYPNTIELNTDSTHPQIRMKR